MKISVVSPVYLGEGLVNELVCRLSNSLSDITTDYEIILVDDGSLDGSWKEIQNICSKNKNVKGIKLSRNFGQHYAITAGLESVSGELVVVIDCDLQDRPEEIPNLFAKINEGYDIVYARRTLRKDGFFKKLFSRIFYRLFSYLTDSKQDSTIANFGIYHKKVIQAILAMKDHVRYFPTMVQWVGFSSSKIDVIHSHRLDGESSYSWAQLIHLGLNNIIAFSNKPLILMVRLGLLISFLSFLAGATYLYQYFMGTIVVLGFASIIISIWFLSGVIILLLGIIGVYLAKTFDRAKERPTFIIDKKINM